MECGVDVLARRRRRYSQYCSVKCQSRASAKNWARNNPGKARERSRRYELSKIRAVPPWLTKEHRDAMAAIYNRAIVLGYEVDHIVPLQGRNVCGLHVPWNLQLLTPTANCEKSNKHAA